MKVSIDQEQCKGTGMCVEMCPDVFMLLDNGKAYVKDVGKAALTEGGEPIYQGIDGRVPVPHDLDEAVIGAEKECGGQCIFIE